jgi:predicted dehydrogenase
MAQKVRWGVIGAGGIADRRTIPGMMLCDNAELVAVMEINMELAEKCRAKWGCKKAYDSEAALLADPEVDAVYIASPVFLHAKQAMAAADAGKHILIEKPLAMTAEEGQKVVDYCKEKGVLIAAGLMMRFGAYVQAMKKAVAEGKIGKPVSGYAQFTCWYPDMPGNWRQSKKNGGGGSMMDMGVHCIDLMQYILGTKVKDVAAFHDTLTFNYEVEDSSTVLLRMEKSNCVLTGPAGVGKSAIVEELASRIEKGKVPDELKHCVVAELSVNRMVAGTKYRGEFEKKIQQLMDYLYLSLDDIFLLVFYKPI